MLNFFEVEETIDRTLQWNRAERLGWEGHVSLRDTYEEWLFGQTFSRTLGEEADASDIRMVNVTHELHRYVFKAVAERTAHEPYVGILALDWENSRGEISRMASFYLRDDGPVEMLHKNSIQWKELVAGIRAKYAELDRWFELVCGVKVLASRSPWDGTLKPRMLQRVPPDLGFASLATASSFLDKTCMHVTVMTSAIELGAETATGIARYVVNRMQENILDKYAS